MADYLAALNERDVAAFYRRLALNIQARFGGDSLAAILLLHWLDGGGKGKVDAARYVRDLSEVRAYLRDTARPIFLSKRLTPRGTLGVVPRIRGTIRDNPPGGPYHMHLEGNVEISITVQAKAAVGMKVDSRELDVLYALHGFTILSDVVVSVAKTASPGKYTAKFESWVCKAYDEYHWDPSKHIPVLNRDYGSKKRGAVAPNQKEITVYHSNAARVEASGLAKPFHNESEPWGETTDLTIIGSDIISI